MSILILCVMAFFVYPVSPAAQQPGPDKRPPPPREERRFPPPEEPRRQQSEKFLYLSGQVLMEDGSPPPDLMVVELHCNGRIMQQIRSTASGYFTIDVGLRRPDNWLDASMGGGTDASLHRGQTVQPGVMGQADALPSAGGGRMNLMGCEVRLQPTPGYLADPIHLGLRSIFDNPDIGAIVVRRLSKEGATTVSLTTLAAPKNAKKAYEKARKELAKKTVNFSSAVKELEKAVQIYPEFAAAWELLGRVHAHQGRLDQSRRTFQRAVRADPEYIGPHIGLVRIEVENQNWEETVRWTTKLLALDDRHPEALYWNGMANYHLRRIETAERSLRLLYEMGYSQRFPYGLLALGVIHANQGLVTEAAGELQSYLRLMPADQVPEEQRKEVESQLQIWESQGLINSNQEGS